MNAAFFLIAAVLAVGAALFARQRHLQKRVRPKSRYFSVSLSQPVPPDPIDTPPQ